MTQAEERSAARVRIPPCAVVAVLLRIVEPLISVLGSKVLCLYQASTVSDKDLLGV